MSVAIITGYYQTILRRTPSDAEVASWNTVVQGGGLTLEQVRTFFLNSPENTNIVDPIIRLYQSAFNRQPDAAGLDHWTNVVRAGTPITQIANLFAQQTEFTNRYGTDTGVSSAYVISLYNNILGRTPSAAEITSWTSSGLSRGAILRGFSDAPEAVTRYETAVNNLLDAVAQGTSTLSPTQPLTTAGTGVVPGQTFTLTTGADSFTGGATNDTFNSVDTTLTAIDTINGGAGTDRLNFSDTSNGGGLPSTAISNIEVFYIRNVETANGGETYDFGGVSGETQVWSDRSTDSVTFDNLATGTTVGLNGDGNTVLGNVTFQMATASAAVSIAIAGGVGASGTAPSITEFGTNGTATTATISSTGAANTVGTVDLADATLTTVTVTAETNLKGDFLSQATNEVGTDGVVTISGAATSVEFTAALDNTIKTITASGLTAGGLTATVGTGTETVTGGAGNDTVVLNTGIKTATFGTGNDTVTTAAINSTTAGAVDGGAGTDTLVVGAVAQVNTSANAARFVNFETLRVNGTLDVSLISGITAIEVSGATNDLSKLTATQAAAVTARADIGATTFALVTATGTSDVLSMTFGTGGSGTAVATNAGALTINGFETLNVATNHGATATDKTTEIASFTADSLTKINLTGTAVTLTNAATTKAVTIDGSALTGALTVGGTLVTGSSVTAGAGNDSFTLGAEGATYTGGNGNDTFSTTAAIINADGATDAILAGGSGTDTLTITGALTLTDVHFTNVTGMENLSSTATTAVSYTGLGAAFKGAYASGVTITTGTLANDATYTLGAGLYDKAMTVTLVSDGVGNSNADNIAITTGSGADTVTVTASSFIGGATNGTISVATGAGNDTISVTHGILDNGTDQANTVLVNGGTGADTISLTGTNGNAAAAWAVVKIAAGDSTTTAYDTVTGFDLGTAALRASALDFDTVALNAYTATAATGFTSAQLTVAVSAAGLVTFAGTSAAAATLAEKIAAVQSVVTTTNGDTAVFTHGGNSYVFNNATAGDSVIELVGIAATNLITTNANTAGAIFIA
jgi:hypothetical protein